MSSKLIPIPTSTLVCDLCGHPIDTYANKDRVALNYGFTPLPQPEVKPRSFIFWRKPYGDNKSGAKKGDYRSWEWDFHGECLVSTLNPLVISESKQEL